MIEYILPHNPDNRVLTKASEFLKAGEIVCFPSDTSWLLCVDPMVKGALEKLHRLKHEQKSKHFSLVCDTISKATDVAIIPDHAFKLLRNKVPGHYTFIFEATKKLSKAIKASKTDKEVGIRFIPIDYINKLLSVHGGVLASTNITHEMLNMPLDESIYSFQIEDHLSNSIKLILDPGEYEFVGESTIYSFASGQPELIREGFGTLLF